MKAIVTVKLPQNPRHDPRNKRTGKCPIGDRTCTDVRGSHHSYIEVGLDLDDIRRKAYEKFGHITRIEVLEVN